MLIQSLRPQTFAQVVGNQLNNKILMSLAKDPTKGPSTLILQGSFGSGKAIDVDALLPTPTGFRRAGDIKEGDLLFSDTGAPETVNEVHIQPHPLDSYKVKFEDGRVVYCSIDHLWTVLDNKTGSYNENTTITLNKLITRLNNHIPVYIPVNGPVQYEARYYSIPPYMMGLLLINSEMDKTTILYKDSSTLKYLKSQIKDITWVENLRKEYYIPTKLVDNETYIIPNTEFYGVYYDAIKEQRIPEGYLLGSIPQRWELLQAIMDSKATISDVNTVFLELPNEMFKDSFLRLAYSLGLVVSVVEGVNSYVLYFKANKRTLHNLFKYREISNTPFNNHIDTSKMEVISVEKEEGVQREMVCFVVNTYKHLYLCNDFIVTHNTTSSRLFAKALNCKNLKENDICGCCERCTADLNSVPWYNEFDSSAINVDTMRDMRDLFLETAKGFNKVVVIDECLNYDQPVICKYNDDCKEIEIGRIVHNKLPVEVLSYNFNSKSFEWCSVTGWHKNSKKIVSKREFVRKDKLRRYFLTCSDNHKVFKPDGTECVISDIQEGDDIIVLDYTKPPYEIKYATYIGKEYIGMCDGEYTYDLTVDGNHNYIANGVLVHNCHLLSKTAQSALLKVFEETPKGIFFLLATTDPDKLLPTIRSRSLELIYTAKSQEEVRKDITKHALRLGISLSPRTIDLIVNRSKGIMRNAHMLLDKVNLIGEEEFLKSDLPTTDLFNKFIKSIIKSDKELVLNTVSELSRIPVSYLRDDWQVYFLDLMRVYLDPSLAQDEKIQKIAFALGKHLVETVKFCIQDWVINSFQNSIQAQTAMLAIYQHLSREFQR